jgi:thymidylate kinase
MFVEFVGRSGTGKSSLCQRVCAQLRHSMLPVAGPLDVLLGARLAQYLQSKTRRNAALETLGVAWTVAARRRFRYCQPLIRSLIGKASASLVERIRLTRSWNRKVGALHGCRRAAANGCTVLLDESTVQFATIVFGRDESWRRSDLDRFLDAVPLADMLVHVDAPPRLSIERLAHRVKQPVPDRDGVARAGFLLRTDEILQHAREHPRIARRWMVVRNDRQDFSSLDQIAKIVAGWIAESSDQFGGPSRGTRTTAAATKGVSHAEAA